MPKINIGSTIWTVFYFRRAQRVPAEKTSKFGLGTITRRTQEGAR
jgi:hypothetical protein